MLYEIQEYKHDEHTLEYGKKKVVGDFSHDVCIPRNTHCKSSV